MKPKASQSFSEFKHSKDSKLPHYLVVGHPISHSLSPVMHSVALTHYSIDAGYFAVDVSPQELSDFIAWLNNDAFLGCNITIPYKKEFLQIPDRLSPEAEAVGAMNTLIKNKSGSLIEGANSDIYGFSVPLEAFEELLIYGRAIVFGSGGASLAVQYALNELGFEEIVIVSRNPQTVQALQGNSFTRIVDYQQWQSFADETELFVNTTPLGMGTREHLSPVLAQDIHFLSDSICYDLVYNPMQTEFLKLAEEAGATTIGGLDMLIHQGSRSFEMWTGHGFPVEKVKAELLKYLES